MTTPEQLEATLQDFINECARHEESCDDCIYRLFCCRFYTPQCDCPSEWTIYDEANPMPS